MIGKKEFLKIWYCCNLKKCWAENFCQVILKNFVGRSGLIFASMYNIIQWVEIFSEGIFKFSICHWFSRNFSSIFVWKHKKSKKIWMLLQNSFQPVELTQQKAPCMCSGVYYLFNSMYCNSIYGAYFWTWTSFNWPKSMYHQIQIYQLDSQRCAYHKSFSD